MTTFRLVQKIGQGSYSKVYKAINDTSLKTLAVKIIPFKSAPHEFIKSRQIKILRECQHPNIAPLLDYFVVEDSIYLVFEYFQMNLNEYGRYYRNIYNRNMDENLIRSIMTQICLGLQYLHSKGIMHRDIKPENVMINPLTQEVKLIDFGFAKHVGQNINTGYMVTRWYRPLEVVLGLNYDHKIDVFAAGAIYFQLIFGKQIFQSSSNTDHLYMLLDICGYPEPGSRQLETLLKMNINNVYKNRQLDNLTKSINDSTREVLSAVLCNSSESRPSIDRLIQHLMGSKMVESLVRSQRGCMMQPRRRANSAANGLTLVSLALSSRERTKSRDRASQVQKESWGLGRLNAAKGRNIQYSEQN